VRPVRRVADMATSHVMPTADIYGFKHEDMTAARRAIESALSICLEEAEEGGAAGGCYYRWEFPDGPYVQLRRNSGPYQRWQGDPSNPWYPDFGVLVWVHGPAQESVADRLRHGVPGLSFFILTP
jgi:hypothetical protein